VATLSYFLVELKQNYCRLSAVSGEDRLFCSFLSLHGSYCTGVSSYCRQLRQMSDVVCCVFVSDITRQLFGSHYTEVVVPQDVTQKSFISSLNPASYIAPLLGVYSLIVRLL